MAKPCENWGELISALPPGLSAMEVARRLQKPFSTVYRNLIWHGYARSNGTHAPRQPGSASWARVKWAQVDWTLSNAVIAETHGVSQQSVHEMRKRLGLPPSIRYTPSASAAPRVKKKCGKKPKWPETTWQKVDWRRQSKDIAAEIGCSGNYVSQMRRKYAPHTLFQPRVPAAVWRKVDWNKSNAQIASELGNGMNVRHVGCQRSQFARHTHSRGQVDWRRVDWRKTNEVIAARFGRNTSYVSRMRGVHAPQTSFSRLAWSKVDWRKGDEDLVAETGYVLGYVRQKRRKHAPKKRGNCSR